MDKRQQQIREQAGLAESKLNVEFIDFLRKWSTPFLLVVVAAALGFVFYQRVQQARTVKVDNAFRELSTVATSRGVSPEALKAIADSYGGVGAVSTLARIKAADAYLQAVRQQMKLGAATNPDGTVPAEDVLTEADRTSYLAEAESLYQGVLDANAPTVGTSIHAIGAAYGLAAVAETRGEADKAKAAYERVIQLADRAGYLDHVELARKRIADLPTLSRPRLFAQAELPKPPAPPAPIAPPASLEPSPVQVIPELKAPTLELKRGEPEPAAQPSAQPATQPATPTAPK